MRLSQVRDRGRGWFITGHGLPALGSMSRIRRTPHPLPWPGFVTAWRAAFGVAVLLVVAGVAVTLASSSEAYIVLATTTSTRDSGLLDYLLPEFSQDTGIGVRYVAVGTGQALDVARRGDADVVMVHAPVVELAFMAEGHGLCRSRVMRNEFIVVGPPSDPAGIRGLTNATVAFARILAARATFVSRGDNSGTHIMERTIWSWVNSTPTQGRDPWYLEAGSGMAATLEMASYHGAYTLSDNGTFLVRRGSLDLEVHVQNDPPLQNVYSVIPVNPALHPNVKASWAVGFAEWLVSPRGQGLIGAYTVGGKQPFHPEAQDGCSLGP